jgi:phosphate acetyltransferase
MSFINQIHTEAARKPARIVFPESNDPRVIEAVETAARLGICRPVLPGRPDDLQRTARKAGRRLDDVILVDNTDEERLHAYAERLAQLRAHKGLTVEQAHEQLRSPLLFAAMMVEQGNADALVAGCVTPTADVVRAAIRIIRPAEGTHTVSSCSVILLPERPTGRELLLFADTAVIPDPTAEQLAQTAVATAATWRTFSDEPPKIAMVSFSTRGSASHPSVQKVRQATERVRTAAPDVAVDGELQVDAALVPEVARHKGVDGAVGGQANILVFPNLDTANVAYKLAERLGNARALGPLLQGLRKPASDLSRGCSARDVLDAAAAVGVQTEKGC